MDVYIKQEQHYFHGDGRNLKQCHTFEVNLMVFVLVFHFGEVCILLTFQKLYFQN